MTFNEYAKKIMDLCAAYLQRRDTAAAKELEKLLPTTDGYLPRNDPAVPGVAALHYCILALYNVETSFHPDVARKYALTSENFFEGYLKQSALTMPKVEYRQTKIWQEAMTIVRAYCDYWNDDFETALATLGRLEANSLTLALAGSAMTRMAYEVDPSYAYPAFDTLVKMDELLQRDEAIDWTYRQDIYRTAYGFLTLFYTSGNVSFPDEPRITHDVSRALTYAYKIYGLVTDEQQKTWAMEDIETCLQHT